MAPTATTDTQSQGSDELGTGVIAGIVVGALILLLAIIAAILFFTGVFRGKGEATNTTGAAPGPIEGSSRVSYRDAYGPDSPVMTPHDTTLVVGSSDINLQESDPSVSFRDVDPLEFYFLFFSIFFYFILFYIFLSFIFFSFLFLLFFSFLIFSFLSFFFSFLLFLFFPFLFFFISFFFFSRQRQNKSC